MPNLGVNVDHVATVRQARRGHEPDPVHAALQCELAGADCITVHLREDRRHIQDRDLERLKPLVKTKLNLEMAATDEMLRIAARLQPDMATLVPEGRAEITTEGGLPVARHEQTLTDAVRRLHDAGVGVSAFIDPDPRQIEAAALAGFDACELHTGPFAEAFSRFASSRAGNGSASAAPMPGLPARWKAAAGAAGDVSDPRLRRELSRLEDAARLVRTAGMRCNAGHALNYHNVGPIAAIPGIWELHIGHAIISRAVFVGLSEAVREIKRLIDVAGLDAAE